MIPKRMSDAGIEAVYDIIADGIDGVDESKRVVFLAKLSLALANLVGDTEMVGRVVAACQRDL